MTKAKGTKKKEHPVIKRQETRMLRHLFTAPETESMTKELASKTLQLRSKMEEKKAIDSQLKGEIDGLASQCNVLAEKVSAGFEVRSVKCQIVLDYGANTKVITREDTNEVVDSTSPIPPDDRQMDALALGGSGEEEKVASE